MFDLKAAQVRVLLCSTEEDYEERSVLFSLFYGHLQIKILWSPVHVSDGIFSIVIFWQESEHNIG